MIGVIYSKLDLVLSMWCVHPLSVISMLDLLVVLVTLLHLAKMVGAMVDANVTLDGVGSRCDLLEGDLRILTGL